MFPGELPPSLHSLTFLREAMMRSLISTFCALFLLIAALPAMGVSEEEMTSLYGREYFKTNPHWETGGCVACHTRTPQKPDLFLRGDENTLCTICHTRGKATDELHSVGTKPSEHVKVPADFPLASGGATSCRTCHDHTPACKAADKQKYRHLLRGAPYAERLEVCYKCHKKDEVKNYNPHELQKKDGKIDEKRCLFCHEKAPDPKKKVERGEYQLRRKMSTICIGCHLITPHAGAFEHLEKPEAKILGNMKESEKKYGILFPLDEAGRLTCATCHNPHEKGVFEEGAAAGVKYEEEKVPDETMKKWKRFSAVQDKDAQYKAKKWGGRDQARPQTAPHAERNMRLTAHNGILCKACHGEGGK